MLAFSITPVLSTLSASRPVLLQHPKLPRSSFTSLRPLHTARYTSQPHVPQMRFGGGGRGEIPLVDRALSVLPYLLPTLDSLSFGRYVFAAAPGLASLLLGPLYPLYALYRGVPFVAFGVFLALFALVVRNPNISRFVRFNTFQALVLDIALIIPQLFTGLRLGTAFPPQVVEVANSSVFYAIALAVGYAVIANVRGQLPDKIPGISDSVYNQIGPM